MSKTTSSPRMRFLFWAAGANPEYLTGTCPRTEQIRHENIGTLICLTAITAFVSMLSALSMSWHLSSISLKLTIALPIAAIWAAFIFLVDRTLVASMRPALGYLAFLLRLALAIFIGFVISHAIQLKLFEPEINKALDDAIHRDVDAKRQMRIDAKASDDDAIDRRYAPQLSLIEKNISDLDTNITILQNKLSAQREEYDRRLADAKGEDANGGGGRPRGRGPVYRSLAKNAENALKAVEDTERQLSTALDDKRHLIENRARMRHDIQTEKDTKANATDREYDLVEKEGTDPHTDWGLLDRIDALWNIRSHFYMCLPGNAPCRSGATVGAVVITVALIFIFIEIAPILAKWISAGGHYDSRLTAEFNTAAADIITSDYKIRSHADFAEMCFQSSKALYKRLGNESADPTNPRTKTLFEHLWTRADQNIRAQFHNEGRADAEEEKDKPKQTSILYTLRDIATTFSYSRFWFVCRQGVIVVLGAGILIIVVYNVLPMFDVVNVGQRIQIAGPLAAGTVTLIAFMLNLNNMRQADGKNP